MYRGIPPGISKNININFPCNFSHIEKEKQTSMLEMTQLTICSCKLFSDLTVESMIL